MQHCRRQSGLVRKLPETPGLLPQGGHSMQRQLAREPSSLGVPLCLLLTHLHQDSAFDCKGCRKRGLCTRH